MVPVPKPSLVPQFLSASTPQGLRRLMTFNNIRMKGFVTYFSIYFDTASKKHIAWFLEEATDQEILGGRK